MRTPLLLVAVAGAACGASSAEIKKARDASFQTDYRQVWQSALDVISSQYEISYQDEKSGVIYTNWKKIERTAEETQDNQYSMRGAMLFRVKVVVRGGPPWTTFVDGVAGELRPGMAVISQFKHGAADEPPWVQGRIDGIYIDIHERLQASAVYGQKPPPPSDSSAEVTPASVEMPNGPGGAGPPAPSVDVNRM